ncbi:DUF3800 domain-containing protein [Cupriavidus oxalaticus]|uniref:DUF3800 domain-containing protein n=1 Tax=Cupriavidus oxalaticus TaxID=96344 RepID=UPI003F73D440
MYFVLAGVSVFERQTHWIESELNNIARRFDESNPHAVELHGSPMRSGREGWKAFALACRFQAIRDCLERGVANQQRRTVRLFGAVIRKAAVADGRDPVELAFEQLSSRFDRFLARLYRLQDDAQRGMMILDKSSTERRIQTLAREFKHRGHAWGQTRNYAEVPVFLDSRASRLIQLADLVAFALFRFHEHGDNTFFDVIKHCFDQDGGTANGYYVHD